MTTEVNNLLIPRIKCAIRYPCSPFPVGAILEQDFEEPEVYNYTDSNNRHWILENPELYPEIFQRLEWWEDRNPEDMPEYIKSNDNKSIRPMSELTEVGIRICLGIEKWLPATEADYNAWKKEGEG